MTEGFNQEYWFYSKSENMKSKRHTEHYSTRFSTAELERALRIHYTPTLYKEHSSK